MKRIKNIDMNTFCEKWIWKIAPLCLVIMPVLKYTLFSMGIMYEKSILETILSYASYILFFAMFVVLMVWTYRTSKEKRWMIALAIIMSFIYMLYLLAILRYGFQKYILKSAFQNLVFCVPALFIGGLIATKRKEKYFFEQFERYTLFILLPVIGYFFMALTNTNPFRNHVFLGTMNYFAVGYYLLPFFCITFLGVGEEKFGIRKKSMNMVRIGLLTMYWLDIVASGARGAIIGCILFMLSYSILKIFHRKKYKKVILLSGIFISIYGVMLLGYAPPGFDAVGRIKIVTQGRSTGTDNVLSDKQLKEVVEVDDTDKSETQSNDTDKGEAQSNDIEQGQIQSNDTEQRETQSDNIKPKVLDRVQLAKTALYEMKNHPLTGRGPFGFYYKYGIYPHNFALELLSELGLVVGGGILLFIIVLVVRVLYCVVHRKDYNTGMMLVFLLGYSGQFLFSGTIWTNSISYFALGYILIFCFQKWGIISSKRDEEV